MIKLTGLYYKLKIPSLERYHNLAEHNASRVFNWETAKEKAVSLDSSYPKKPFIEPFEFKEDDYDVTEKAFRVRLEDILLYKENVDNVVEVTIDGGESFTVKETIAEIDALFGI